MADYKLEGNPGDTVFLLRPLHAEAAQNLKDHSSEETQFLGNAMAVEHRYISELLVRLNDEGWEVE